MSRIRGEIRQRKPFPTPAQEAIVTLLRTADVVRRILGAVTEAQGLTLQQYNVLRILRGAGADGLPTLEIGARMVEHAPGITRLLDRVEQKGLVVRERCPRDRRQVLCRITPQGLERLARLDQPVVEGNHACMGGLQPAELERFVALLDAVRAPLAAAPESGQNLPGPGPE